MKYLFNIIKALALILVAGLLYGLPASAQQTATLGKGPILVRLCPVSCIAVNGHGLKAGREVEVFETRSGWIRVSRFLNRRRLTKTFGQTITREPALWVSLTQVAEIADASGAATVPNARPTSGATAQETASEPAKSETKTKQLADLKRVATPSFRPGTKFARLNQEEVKTAEKKPEQPEVETEVVKEEASRVEATTVAKQEEAKKAADAAKAAELAKTEADRVPAQEAPKTESETVAAKAKPVSETSVVEQSAAAGDSSEPAAEPKGRLLTWEELQKKLAEQQAEHNRVSQQNEEERANEAKEQAELAAQQEERRKAAEAAEAERQAQKKKEEEARKAAELAKAKEAEEAAKAAEAKKAAEAARAAELAKAKEAEEAKKAAEAKKAEEAAKAAELAKAKEAEEAAKALEAKKAAEEAAKVAEAKKAAEIAKAKAAEEAAKVAEAKKAEEAKQVAALEAKKEEGPEPTYKAANTEPITFGSRPKTLTKALLDKRLSKLPGSKSRVRKEVVIALRHYALSLLESGECKGIAGGGPSAVPGMLYVACSDDPTYLRQFPIKEETW